MWQYGSFMIQLLIIYLRILHHYQCMGHSRPVVGFSFIAVEVTTREEWTEEGGDGKRRRGGGEKIWEWKENNRNDTPFDALTNAKSFSSDIIRHTSRISCLPVLSPRFVDHIIQTSLRTIIIAILKKNRKR
ncbi:Hypothetical predicted protein [Octopus vulgaris]|uniref:Uncharacterized protein n=1 Tax=Octopus vulgaris TaxID=6645 RepID=A0AA36BQS8_OCTVU|nr:Hypothetical predicted protein [Octopus vulgaris]